MAMLMTTVRGDGRLAVLIVLDETNLDRIQKRDPLVVEWDKLADAQRLPAGIGVVFANAADTAKIIQLHNGGQTAEAMTFATRGFEVKPEDHDRGPEPARDYVPLTAVELTTLELACTDLLAIDPASFAPQLTLHALAEVRAHRACMNEIARPAPARPVQRTARAVLIQDTVRDVGGVRLFWDDRKDDQLRRGEIEAAVRAGEIDADEIVEIFRAEVENCLREATSDPSYEPPAGRR